MTVRHLLAATLTGVVMAGTAQAEVYITGAEDSAADYQTATEAEQRWQADGRVIVRATGKGGLADYVGFGEDVALAEAIGMVKPSGWVVHYADDVARDRPVSWDVDDGIWVDGLYEIMRDAGYDATVAIDDQRIRVHERPAAVTTAADGGAAQGMDGAAAQEADAPATGSSSEDEHAGDKSASRAGNESPESGSAVGSQTVTLTLSAGESLREQLSAFAEASGWQLHWDVETDYTVGFDAEASGTYMTVIEQVVEAINGRNAETFTATAYANRVVRITNK